MSEPPVAPPPPPAGGLPWEERARYGAFNGFVETLRRLVTAPAAAFAEARRTGELVSPIAYAVLIGWLGVLAERMWSFLFGTSLLDLMPREFGEAWAAGYALSGLVLAVVLVLTPIFVLVGLFVWGAIVHLFLLVYGGTKDSDTGFEGTLRALGWSATAQLGQLVPLVGGLVAFVWSIVLQTIGLATFHRTSRGRALAAVLTPLLLCCVCFALFFASVVAMVVGAALGADR